MKELPTEAESSEALGERFEPTAMHGLIIEAEHLARYTWAAQFAAGAKTLDIACGAGYGSAMLAAGGAAAVTGIDLDPGVVGRISEGAPEKVSFEVGDIRDLSHPDDEFDLITCFETIEHVPDPEKALDELRRVLKPDGLLVLSTPNRDVYTPGNPFHMRELSPNELQSELEGRFRNVRLRRQHSWIASGILDDDEFRLGDNDLLDGVLVRKAAGLEPGEETYTIALASDGELPAATAQLTTTLDVDLREWSRFMERASQDAEIARGRLEGEPRAEVELLKTELSELRQRLLESEADLAGRIDVEAKLASTEAVLRESEGAIAQNRILLNSTSWRVTRPLRAIMSRLRKRK